LNGADSGELTKAHEFVFSALFQYIFIYLVAMADEVQKILERSIPELEDLLERGLFTEDEVRSITNRRRDYEYRLQRREKMKEDFVRYIQYENSLEDLRKMRKKRLKLTKETVSDFACTKRIQFIYDRALNRFQHDSSMWLECIQHAIDNKSAKRIARLFPRALQLHPLNTLIWLKAAEWEYSGNQSHSSARILLTRGLRLNKGNVDLFRELYKLEIKYVLLLKTRRRALGLEVPNAEGEGEQLAIPTLPGETKQEDDPIVSKQEQAKKSMLEGQLAVITFNHGMKEIKESERVNFCLECLAIASDAQDEVPLVARTILAYCENVYAGKEMFWKARAEWHLIRGSDSKEGKKRDRHDEGLTQAMEVYKEAVRSLPTPLMFKYYLNFLQSYNTGTNDSEIENVFYTANEAGALQVELFERWFDLAINLEHDSGVLRKKNKRQKSKTLSGRARTPKWVAEEAVKRFSGSGASWELLIKCLMRNLQVEQTDQGTVAEIEEVFRNATEATAEKGGDGQQNIELLWVRFLDAMDRKGEEIREHALGRLREEKITPETKIAIYDECVQAILDGHDKEEIKTLFGKVEKSSAFLVTPWEVYSATIYAAQSLRPLDVHFVRQMFEKAILIHGNRVALWLEYMKFESNSSIGGDISKLATISWGAKQNLSKADAEVFEETWQRERLMS
jgi:hypothetical protein